jgi:hypothetical protein
MLNQKNKIFSFSILISVILFGILASLPTQAIVSDGAARELDLAPESMVKAVKGMRSNAEKLKYLPNVYISKVTYDLKTHESNLNRRAYNLLSKNFTLSSYYDVLAREVQKSYNLINATELFVNQHNENHADYIDGADKFTSVALQEISPYLSNLQNLKNDDLTSVLEAVNIKINELMELNFTQFQNILQTANYKELERSLSLEDAQQIKANLNQAIGEVRADVEAILDIAEDPTKLVSN